jgi:hypothetical protein
MINEARTFERALHLEEHFTIRDRDAALGRTDVRRDDR